MNLKDAIECGKQIATVRVTDSALISNTPALIFSVIGTCSAGAGMESEIYDGSNDSGDIKLDLYTLNTDSKQFIFNPPMLMSRGIYVKAVKKVKSVVVQFADVRE